MRVIGGREAGQRLAAALVARLASEVPAGITVTAQDDTLWITDGLCSSGTPLGWILDPDVPMPVLGPLGIGIAPDATGESMFDGTRQCPELELDDFRESVAIATTNALSRIQDFVTETLTVPWPPSRPGGARPVIPQVEVEWSGPDLNIWFGDADRPELRLAPISQDELAQPVQE